MSKKFRLLDESVTDLAIEAYFAEHPELDPMTTSVQLIRDGAMYRAVGHETIAQPIAYLAPTAEVQEIDLATLAEDAFIAYSNRLNHTNHTMDVAEGWENQGPEVREGFAAAAAAIRDRVLGKPLPHVAPGLAHLQPVDELAKGGIVEPGPMMVGE